MSKILNRMKIGFVSSTFRPDIENCGQGVYKRMGMFIEAMKTIADLDMLFYVDERIPISASYMKEMEERLSNHWGANLKLTLSHLAPWEIVRSRWQYYGRPAISVYNRTEYSNIVRKEQILAFHEMLSRKPDIVFVHRLSAMCVIMLSENHLPPIFFDLDDVEHISFARSVRQPPWWWAKWLLYLQVPSLLIGERRAIRTSSKTFVCSEHDRLYLSRVWGLRNVVTIPNGTEIFAESDLPAAPTMLFIGTFGYYPNVVGADYLIKKIWPLILSAVPNAKLLIAGEIPEHIPSFKESPRGVEFRGFVENLEDLYKEVRVVCCPILSGGGTRIKVLEAAAYGKPIVSTTIGAEGIDLLEGQEVLLRDDSKSFAEACIQLFTDNNLATRIGKAARSAIARSYDRSVIVQKISEHLTV